MASCLLPSCASLRADTTPRRRRCQDVRRLQLPSAFSHRQKNFLFVMASAADSPPPHQQHRCSSSLARIVIAPLAACLALSFFSPPAEAGILSGSSGLRSFELPTLPRPESLKRIQEENKTRYEGLDEKFKTSPFVQELLKRSKQNAELRKKEIQDKYCRRGADWGVGDCSTAAMSEEERASFIESLKEKEAPE